MLMRLRVDVLPAIPLVVRLSSESEAIKHVLLESRPRLLFRLHLRRAVKRCYLREVGRLMHDASLQRFESVVLFEILGVPGVEAFVEGHGCHGPIYKGIAVASRIGLHIVKKRFAFGDLPRKQCVPLSNLIFVFHLTVPLFGRT